MSHTIGNGKYLLQRVLGTGAFGQVYFSSPNYAVKQVHRGKNHRQKHLIQNQIEVLNSIIKLKNDNIVKLHQIVYQNEFIYLVMQYCQEDLSKQIKTYVGNEQKGKFIIRQIINGYRQLFNKNIVHRDLKPANLLLKKGIIKIADFGFSKLRDNLQVDIFNSLVGTPRYMPPQIFWREPYTSKCDVWSLGIIYFQLLTGTFPWGGINEKNLIDNIMNQQLRFPKGMSNDSRHIISRMLQLKQVKRADWRQIFEFFIDLPLQKKRIATQSELKGFIEIELLNLKMQKGKIKNILNGKNFFLDVGDINKLNKFLNTIRSEDWPIFTKILNIKIN